MKVSKERAKAHWESREHWQDNYEKGSALKYEDIVSNNCPNCLAATRRILQEVICDKCPVAIYSDAPDCANTPWVLVSDVFEVYYADEAKFSSALEEAVVKECEFLTDVAFDMEIV